MHTIYSSLRSGFVEIANVKSYQQHRAKYVEKGKSKGSSFGNAVKKADEFSMDPIVIAFRFPSIGWQNFYSGI